MTRTATAPVVTASAITAGVTALLALVTAFAPGALNETQQAAILGVVAVVAPLIVGYIGRQTTLEYRSGSSVYRGAANEGDTGEYVRELSDAAPVLVAHDELAVTRGGEFEASPYAGDSKRDAALHDPGDVDDDA